MALSLSQYQFTKTDPAQANDHDAGETERSPLDYSLTTDDVATLTGNRPITIRRYARKGIIRSAKWGGRYHFRAEDVDAWIEACRVSPTRSPVAQARPSQPERACRVPTGRSMADVLSLYSTGGA